MDVEFELEALLLPAGVFFASLSIQDLEGP
jgi:hypothetical protein